MTVKSKERRSSPDEAGDGENHESDLESLSLGGTSESANSSPSQPLEERGDPVIAQEENAKVFRLKLLVISVLIASTICVAFGVFLYLTNAEKKNFERQFDDDSNKVLEAIGTSLDLTLGSVDAFLVSLVSYAKSSNSSWPFVTLPDYAVKLAKLRTLSKAVLVSQYHWVEGVERGDWEAYSVQHDAWVQQGIDTQKTDENFHGKIVIDYWTRGDIHDSADYYTAPGPYLPKWQQAPVIPVYAPYNWDAMTFSSLANSLPIVQGERKIAISDISNLPDYEDIDSIRSAEGNNHFIKDYVGDNEDETEPFSDIYFPILDYAADYVSIPKNDDQNSLGKFVGVFAITFYWRDLIKDILPTDSDGMIIIFQNTCNETFTYQVNGPETIYLGEGDLHEKNYDYLSKTAKLTELDEFGIDERTYSGIDLSDNGCAYTISLYPSEQMEDDHRSNDPIIFTFIAVAIFAFTSMVFIFYDYMVERRQAKVMQSAAHTSAIVSSLFPSTVRDRLFQNDRQRETNNKFEQSKAQFTRYLSDRKTESSSQASGESLSEQRPIADLFPDCTVLFSDISGFTAWSSTREPVQVFTLLETLYSAFDRIAARRRVFKVETIGDAYVAVTGLPEPRHDHAIVMTKFARDCLIQMVEKVRDLEKNLGPGTADLRLRIGLHSGPVTAGVLRGQKSRFQLFGDTVNTASRMESTGFPNKIQVSSVTADILAASGKANWIVPRDEKIEAKGKGTMQTYWIVPKLMGSNTTGNSDGSDDFVSLLDDKTKRLVDWNVDILGRLIKKVIAKRGAKDGDQKPVYSLQTDAFEDINTPSFDPTTSHYNLEETNLLELEKEVGVELRDYVVTIAALYNCNPFHCFDHASHVAMSVAKLLSRITAPVELGNDGLAAEEDFDSSIHSHALGIVSDPLAQFACVFSALIHDVDHPGVPNCRLVEEKSELAVRYQGKCIAEQNSLDMAWNLLMKDSFDHLRRAICPTPKELARLRQLVVTFVLATDIMDPTLRQLQKERWERAFRPPPSPEDPSNDDDKAAILLEHLIQASDVAHTMQHWHIYQKWNELLFREMSKAYASGRAATNPADFWYDGELRFLDTYVLPLAKKLRDCGALGASSTGDELYDYATKNREQWAARGREIVLEFVKNI